MDDPVIVVSDEVRALIGDEAADRLTVGDKAPPAVQCWRCGGGVRVAGGRPGSVAMSLLIASRGSGQLTLTIWSHINCGPSRHVSFDEFSESPGAHIPSPVPEATPSMLIEPLADEPPPEALVTPQCPTCDQPPVMVLGGGEQAFCGNDDCSTWTWNAMLTRHQLDVAEVGQVDLSGLAGLLAPRGGDR